MKRNWIRQIMDERDISIKELSETLDIAENTVRNYYFGWKKPGKKVRLNLIKIFDLEEDEVDD